MEEGKIKELLDLVRSITLDEFQNEITIGYNYENLIKEIQFLKNKVHNDHQKSNLILDHITQIASGDLSAVVEIDVENTSIIDAIAMGINVFIEELRESTVSLDEFKGTLNALPYVVWASNVDFSKVLYVNESVEQIFGVSSSEMLENKNLWVDLIHPEDRKYVEDKFDEFFISGHFDVKYRLLKPSGEEVWILDQAKFLLDSEGVRYRIVGICKDITEQELGSIKLKNYTKNLADAQQIARMGSWEFNLKTHDVNWSKELYHIFDIEEKITGPALYKAYRDTIHPDDLVVLDKHVEICATKGIPYDFEHRIYINNGAVLKYIRAIGNPSYNETGEIIGLSGIGQDFTDKKLIEIQNEKNQRRLEEAQHISKIGSWEWELTTGNLYWSKEHFNIFEIEYDTDPTILYQIYRNKIHPEDLRRLDGLIAYTSSTGKPFEFYHRALLKDGAFRYVKGIGNAIFDENSNVIGIQGTAQDITAQYLQEQKLNETLNSLNAVLDSTEYSIISTNLDGIITLFNKGAENMLGYKAEELVGIKSPELIHVGSEVENKAKELSQKLGVEILPGIDVFHYIPRELNTTYTDQWTYVSKEGKEIPVSLTLNTVRDEKGELKGYLGVSKDMTVENAKNQEILAIKTELQNFFDLTSDCMCIANMDGTFKSVNNTFVNVLGYTKEELDGSLFTDLIHPDDLECTFLEIEKLSKGVFTIDFENRFRCKNGEYVWLSWRTAPDIITGDLYATARDITLKREQDLKLRKALNSVQEYKHALDQIALVSSADLQGNIISANDRFSEISGYSLHELIGKNHRIVNSGYHPKSFFEGIWRTIASGKIWRGEICNRKKTGELYWVDTVIVPFLDENGKPLWHFSIRYDITDKKSQEDLVFLNLELQKEKELAEQKTKLKERFLANMSHEIRTPMNSILGLSNLMEKVGTLNPKQMDYIKTIKLNSKNLLNIINDILDLSKIEEGKLELEISTIDIRELITTTVKTLTLNAHKKKIDLVSDVDSSLPRFVLGDSTRLNQVILNLTNNAIKFTDEGSVTIVVKQLSKLDDKVLLRFEIIDTGIGIAKEKIEKIFEPFTQEKTSTTRLYGGTGLGLTISNQIIQAFGSQIQVNSTINKGSTFFFDIEFYFTNELIPFEKTTLVGEEQNLPILSGVYSILLVEDNLFNQMVAEDTLKDWYGEFIIDIAENGKVALEKMKVKHYDLILMDIQMPEMDGHQATKIARYEYHITAPIIAMTAQATPSEIEACIVSGMNDYISKPFEEQKLYATITKWLLNNE